jgi:predicted dehydrogenase
MINLGIIGYGYLGPNLLRNFAELPGVTVTALSDLRSSQLDVVSRRYPSIKTTTHFEDIIADKSIDAVAVATPVATHFELGMAVLKSGKHLWLEKPMTETSHQAEMLVEEAEKRSLALFVDHTFIYTGAVQKMGELVKNGDLGKYCITTRLESILACSSATLT